MRAVGGVVVDHDDVEREVRLLAEGRADGVGNGALPVPYGDDHTGFNGERAFFRIDGEQLVCIDKGSQRTQMVGAGALHVYLDGAVAGVHVVKLLLSRRARVQLLLVVETFGDVDEAAHAREEEPHLVEAGKRIFSGL